MKIGYFMFVAPLILSGCNAFNGPSIAASWQNVDPSLRSCLSQYDYQETLSFDDPVLAPANAACHTQIWQSVSPFVKSCLSTDPYIQTPDFAHSLPDDPRLQTAIQNCQEREQAVQRDDVISRQRAIRQNGLR